MNQIERIRAKIHRIEELCAEVLEELDKPEQAEATPAKPRKKADVHLPTEAESRDEYDRLFEAFVAGRPSTVEEFVRSNSREYLQAFGKANNLSIDPLHVAKQRVAEEIIRSLATRKAITGGASG